MFSLPNAANFEVVTRISSSPVPEPCSMALAGCGLAMFGMRGGGGGAGETYLKGASALPLRPRVGLLGQRTQR